MLYRFEFKPYRRQFKQPLATSHGLWQYREGFILCLKDEVGRVGFGEIAPIPWFGSESLAAAAAFCCGLPPEITEDQIFGVPDSLPACQFGLESAWIAMIPPQPPLIKGGSEKKEIPFIKGGNEKKEIPFQPLGQVIPKKEGESGNKLKLSGLLPAGEAALSEWVRLWESGYRTFKWKIGVKAVAEELAIFTRLVSVLPPRAKLRLDANGGLSFTEAIKWLQVCDSYSFWVEFLEQPLPVSEFEAMLDLSQRFTTPLALDESVANLTELEACYEKGWRGVFVVKPAIAGSPRRLRKFCLDHDVMVVFSSALETEIARDFCLKLAGELNKSDLAMGFGVDHWFVEDGLSDYGTCVKFFEKGD